MQLHISKEFGLRPYIFHSIKTIFISTSFYLILLRSISVSPIWEGHVCHFSILNLDEDSYFSPSFYRNIFSNIFILMPHFLPPHCEMSLSVSKNNSMLSCFLADCADCFTQQDEIPAPRKNNRNHLFG